MSVSMSASMYACMYVCMYVGGGQDMVVVVVDVVVIFESVSFMHLCV